MSVSAASVRLALYNHGPCSAATVAGQLGLTDVKLLEAALGALGAEVATRTVALPGAGVAPVVLLHLRGFGVG
jgi:hypothetical protein